MKQFEHGLSIVGMIRFWLGTVPSGAGGSTNGPTLTVVSSGLAAGAAWAVGAATERPATPSASAANVAPNRPRMLIEPPLRHEVLLTIRRHWGGCNRFGGTGVVCGGFARVTLCRTRAVKSKNP